MNTLNLRSKLSIVGALAFLFAGVAIAAVKGDQTPAIMFSSVTCPSFDAGAGGSVAIPDLSNSNSVALANEGSAKVYIGTDAGVTPSTGFPIAAGTQLGIDIVQLVQGSGNTFDGGTTPVFPKLYCTTTAGSTTDLRVIRVK